MNIKVNDNRLNMRRMMRGMAAGMRAMMDDIDVNSVPSRCCPDMDMMEDVGEDMFQMMRDFFESMDDRQDERREPESMEGNCDCSSYRRKSSRRR